MLTKALNLKANGSSQTFADVTPSSWDYNAVEAAKDYLTGYQTSNGTMYFYGSKKAVREDMAVTLVKALNLTVESNNSKLQDTFTDYNAISVDLRDYVYSAYINDIMKGSNNKFNPQGTLTRAEAAVLLEKALENTKKVLVDGSSNSSSEKIVVNSSDVSNSYDTDATLSNLTYDATTVTGFAANKFTYNIELPANTTTVPIIAATANDTGNATLVVIQAASLPGTAIVLVTAEDGTTTNTYTITFTVAES